MYTTIQLKYHNKNLVSLLDVMNLNFIRLEMKQQLLKNSENTYNY